MNEQQRPVYADAAPGSTACQNCGHVNPFQRYHCFALESHPEWKEVLLEGNFYHWNCPECGNVMEINYSSSLVDPALRLSVVLRPGIEQENISALTAELNRRREGVGVPGWMHRAVGNFQSMQELVRVREAGLDDRVIHLMKPLIIGTMQSMGKEVWNGFFTHVEQQPADHDNVVVMAENENQDAANAEPVVWYQIHLTNGEVERQGINWTGYRICEQLLQKQGIGEDSGKFMHYDLGWAIDFQNKSH